MEDDKKRELRDERHDEMVKQWQKEYNEKLKRANEELKEKGQNRKILCILTIPDFILKKAQEKED